MLEIEETLLDDELLKELATMHKVLEQLKNMGIHEPEAQGVPPKVPIDVAKVTNDKWSELFARLLGHYDYISYHTALAEGNRKEADTRLKYIKAKLKTLGVKEVEEHALYVSGMAIKQEAEQLCLMLDAAKSALGKKMDMISRDFERRKDELGRIFRQENAGYGRPTSRQVMPVREKK